MCVEIFGNGFRGGKPATESATPTATVRPKGAYLLGSIDEHILQRADPDQGNNNGLTAYTWGLDRVSDWSLEFATNPAKILRRSSRNYTEAVSL